MSNWSRTSTWLDNQPPPLVVEEDEGFVDFTIPIYARAVEANGTHLFHARANTPTGLVGLVVAVHPAWERWDLEEDDITLWRGYVSYRSTGPESDEFLQAVARHYRAGISSAPFDREVTFAAVALNGNPAEVLEEGADIKLFYEPGPDEDYAEIYTNVHPTEGVVQVREKDNDYRQAFLRALAQNGGPAN